jgi:hypothetical protein
MGLAGCKGAESTPPETDPCGPLAHLFDGNCVENEAPVADAGTSDDDQITSDPSECAVSDPSVSVMRVHQPSGTNLFPGDMASFGSGALTFDSSTGLPTSGSGSYGVGTIDFGTKLGTPGLEDANGPPMAVGMTYSGVHAPGSLTTPGSPFFDLVAPVDGILCNSNSDGYEYDYDYAFVVDDVIGMVSGGHPTSNGGTFQGAVAIRFVKTCTRGPSAGSSWNGCARVAQ